MEVVNLLRGLTVSKKYSVQNDDLFVDRLNHRYTVAIILVFCTIVTASHYVGSPINCWVPGHFTGNYANYADNICWVSSTYNVPLNEDLPSEENERKVKMLKYYQWTPFILLFQALLFYLPRMIWRSLSDKSGLDLQAVVDAVSSYSKDITKSEDRQKILDYLTNSFDHYVSSTNKNEKNRLLNNTSNNYQQNVIAGQHSSQASHTLHKRKINYNKSSEDMGEFSSDAEEFDKYDEESDAKSYSAPSKLSRFSRLICITKGKRFGNYLLGLFVFVKLLYTLNSFIQLFLLNHFLGNDYLLLGVEVIGKVWYGDDWTQLKRFPRVTMCDFRIREVGIVHRYTVQCVLSINLFNEKIFIFLWFWFCIISILNTIDLVAWSYTLVLNSRERYSYVKRRLTSLNPTVSNTTNHLYYNLYDPEEKRLFKKFVSDYLREDGVLALRLLSRNSQDLIVSELIGNLFHLYKKQNQSRQHHKHLKPLFLKQNTESEVIDDVNEKGENELTKVINSQQQSRLNDI